MKQSVTIASGASAATKVTVEAVAGATTLETNGAGPADVAGAVSTSSKYASTKNGDSMTFYIAQATDSTALSTSVQYYKYTVSGLTGVTGGKLDTSDSSTVGTYTDASGTVTSSSASGTGKSIYNLDISALNRLRGIPGTAECFPKAG